MCYPFYKKDKLVCVFSRKFTAIRYLILEKNRVQSTGVDIDTTIEDDSIMVKVSGYREPFVWFYEIELK